MLKLCNVKLEAATAWHKKRCKEKEKEKNYDEILKKEIGRGMRKIRKTEGGEEKNRNSEEKYLHKITSRGIEWENQGKKPDNPKPQKQCMGAAFFRVLQC